MKEKRFGICFSLMMAFSFASQTSWAHCTSPTQFLSLPAPSLEEKTYVAAQIYRGLQEYFAHWDGLPASYDFEAEYKTFLHQLLPTTTRLAYDRVVWHFFADLKNGHTRYADEMLSCQPELPFAVEEGGGAWVVSASQLKTLPVGAVVQEISFQDSKGAHQSLSFAHFLQQESVFVAASSPRSQLRAAAYATSRWPVRFELILQNGHHVAVDREKLFFHPVQPFSGSSADQPLQSELLKNGILIERLTSFQNPATEQKALEILRTTPGIKGVVFDLRGNGGGRTPVTLMKAIIEKPFQELREVTPQHIALYDAYASYGLPGFDAQTMLQTGSGNVQPEAPFFHGKVYVLTDGGTASAAEDFALAVKLSGRGKIMGTPTYGSTGQVMVLPVPAVQGEIWIGTLREYYPDGKSFEGVGVVPDVPLTAGFQEGGEAGMQQQALAIVQKDLEGK